MPEAKAVYRRYVDLILMHGGIPDYSLPDYFNNMLRSAVLRDLYADMSAEELIDEWLHYASGRYITDKPVLRFLEFGGQIAVDFVERTRELAREFLEAGLTPTAEEVGLPQFQGSGKPAGDQCYLLIKYS